LCQINIQDEDQLRVEGHEQFNASKSKSGGNPLVTRVNSEENFLAPKAGCPWPTPDEAPANPEFVERLEWRTRIFSDVKEVFPMTPESAAPAQELKLETEKISEAVLVHCTGRIVSSTSPLLQSTVRPLIADNKRVVLNLTNVSYLDSSGLGTIVGLWVNAKKNNCDLKLIRLNERIKELLRLSNLGTLEGDQEYLGF
jgi:anti-sigma B factor antagonist